MLKKLLPLVCILFAGAIQLFAEPTMAVLPAQGRGRPAQEFADNLSEELPFVYRTIRGAVAVAPEKVIPAAVLKAFAECGVDRRCVEKVSAKVRKADLVLFPLVTVRRDGTTTVNLYVYSNKGRQVARYVVNVEPGFDEEDAAADVAAALMTVSSDIESSPGFRDDDDDDDDVEVAVRREREPPPRRREPPPSTVPRASDVELRTTLRNGFKAYKGGDIGGALNLFREARDDKLAQDAEDVTSLIERAEEMLENREYDRAIESLKRAERIDLSIRERGYKELQFIRETTRRDRYNEPKEADFRKVDALFRGIRKEIGDVADWRRSEIEKAERSISDQLRERERINREFEINEEKQREKEREEEREHKRKIEDLKSDLAGLDSKYREKLMDSEKEISRLNRRLEDQRPAEERFRREIEKEQRMLEKKRREFDVGLRRDLKLAEKKARAQEDKINEAGRKEFQQIQSTLKSLDEKLRSIAKEIEKENVDFDRNEQKEHQLFERASSRAEAQDRKDIEEAEKLNAKEVATLNRELEAYDRKVEKAAKRLDVFDREIADYVQKQEMRLQKSQELANRNREQLERKFDSVRMAAENKAEEEYRRGQEKRARNIETLEKRILGIEERDINYEKNAQWISSRKELRNAMADLAKYEENHINFIDERVAPVVKEHRANIKKLEDVFSKLESTIQQEITSFTKKKNAEKAVAEKELRSLENGRSAFEAGIQKRIAQANAKRDKTIQQIEARTSKREAERVANAKKRRAAFEKAVEAKRKSMAAIEKQMEALSIKAENLRIGTAKKLEQLRISNEKMLRDMAISHDKQRDAQEIVFEKERLAIYEKYEKRGEAEKEEIIKEIDKIEKGMRELLVQRGKEEVALKNSIAAAEKQTDVMYNRWESEAKKRRAVLERDLAAAEKRENAARSRLESQKQSIEDQYNKKVEAIISKAAGRLDSSEDRFTTERDRTYEFSAQTRKINTLIANALSNMGNEKLKRGDIAGARKDFYEALYYESDNRNASEGIKAMEKLISETYRKADQAVSEDPRNARSMLLDLKKQLEPDDPYYLRVLALLEELR